MIIQDVRSQSVKMYLPFNNKTDKHILSDRFGRDLRGLDRDVHNETARKINDWVTGIDKTPIFEFKNRFVTGKSPRHIMVYGVQIRHRQPSTHVVLYVEKIDNPNPKLPPGNKFIWHRIYTDYDEYKTDVNPTPARDMFRNAGL
jgi:hypothetical protein